MVQMTRRSIKTSSRAGKTTSISWLLLLCALLFGTVIFLTTYITNNANVNKHKFNLPWMKLEGKDNNSNIFRKLISALEKSKANRAKPADEPFDADSTMTLDDLDYSHIGGPQEEEKDSSDMAEAENEKEESEDQTRPTKMKKSNLKGRTKAMALKTQDYVLVGPPKVSANNQDYIPVAPPKVGGAVEENPDEYIPVAPPKVGGAEEYPNVYLEDYNPHEYPSILVEIPYPVHEEEKKGSSEMANVIEEPGETERKEEYMDQKPKEGEPKDQKKPKESTKPKEETVKKTTEETMKPATQKTAKKKESESEGVQLSKKKIIGGSENTMVSGSENKKPKESTPGGAKGSKKSKKATPAKMEGKDIVSAAEEMKPQKSEAKKKKKKNSGGSNKKSKKQSGDGANGMTMSSSTTANKTDKPKDSTAATGANNNKNKKGSKKVGEKKINEGLEEGDKTAKKS